MFLSGLKIKLARVLILSNLSKELIIKLNFRLMQLNLNGKILIIKYIHELPVTNQITGSSYRGLKNEKAAN